MNRDKETWWQERIKADRKDWINLKSKGIKKVLVDTRFKKIASKLELKSA